MTPIALAIPHNDGVGYVLLLVTVILVLIGYRLSQAGFQADAAAAQLRDAASKATVAASKAQETTARAQQSIAQERGENVQTVADSSLQMVTATSLLTDQIGEINDSLSKLTGNQTPARVVWSLAALCLVAALVSFDLFSATFGSAGT
jgi:Sec-independent protein translocase protein TatA